MPIEQKTIHKTYLIVCEGKDALLFLIDYLESEALKEDPRFANDIEVFRFDGNSELSRTLRMLQNTDGYEQVKRILVIRDAEMDPKAAKQCIQSAFEHNHLPIPLECNQWKSNSQGNIQTAYSLFPTCDRVTEPGTLEDLCWRILSDDCAEEMRGEIIQFLSIMKTKHSREYPREFKNKLHAYLSATDEYVSLKLGEAAKAGAYNWHADELNPLRDVIKNGFTKLEPDELP